MLHHTQSSERYDDDVNHIMRFLVTASNCLVRNYMRWNDKGIVDIPVVTFVIQLFGFVLIDFDAYVFGESYVLCACNFYSCVCNFY